MKTPKSTLNQTAKFQTIKQPECQEKQQIKEITDITEQLLNRRYADNKVLRAVHPKAHGCVKATFTINDDIDAKYRVGILSSPGKSYQAMIRFSNATGLVTDDVNADGSNNSRGMAIKVFGVEEGGAFLDKDNGARNQDFLMINSPEFAIANVPDYLRLNKVILKDNESVGTFFAPLFTADKKPLTPAEVKTTAESLRLVKAIAATPVNNPLEVQYFSAAPFAFGDDKVMHFSVRPVGELKPQQQPTPSPNYLKEALINTLSEPENIKFDFMVQVRDANDNNLGLENASTRWREENHPFIKVATLSISAPQTGIDSVEQEKACENLVFTPWHSLKAHQPLGGINRLRQSVYQTSASVRGVCPHHKQVGYSKK